MPNVNRKKMKSALLYLETRSRGSTNRFCRIVHAKNVALSGAIYTLNVSIFVVLVYVWRISMNMKKTNELGDVYYGVQIAYFIIIGTQLSVIVLSIALIYGIYRENCAFVVLWVIGFITFMALEAVAMVYSNVLRDHVNRQFDAICKAEVALFITRAFINAIAVWGVLRFYHSVRAGVTWKGSDVIEL